MVKPLCQQLADLSVSAKKAEYLRACCGQELGESFEKAG